MGENTIKQTTLMGGHYLKFYFYILKNHMGSTIIWIFNISFGIGCISCKVSTFKIWFKSKVFLSHLNIQTFQVTNSFSKHQFSLSNVHCSFSELERMLTLIIKNGNTNWNWWNPSLNAFGSNVLLTLKIMNFENVVLTKLFIFMW